MPRNKIGGYRAALLNFYFHALPPAARRVGAALGLPEDGASRARLRKVHVNAPISSAKYSPLDTAPYARSPGRLATHEDDRVGECPLSPPDIRASSLAQVAIIAHAADAPRYEMETSHARQHESAAISPRFR